MPSRTRPGVRYLVTRMDDYWHCECVGFFYRGHCRHVEAAKGIMKPRDMLDV